jgi:hypothetical protein
MTREEREMQTAHSGPDAFIRKIAQDEAMYRKALSFIRCMEIIERKERVAIVNRVTTRGQKRNGSLYRQDWANRTGVVRGRGGKVAYVFSGAGFKGHSRTWFACLDRVFAKIAKRTIKKVVFRGLSRLVCLATIAFPHSATISFPA